MPDLRHPMLGFGDMGPPPLMPPGVRSRLAEWSEGTDAPMSTRAVPEPLARAEPATPKRARARRPPTPRSLDAPVEAARLPNTEPPPLPIGALAAGVAAADVATTVLAIL